MPLSVTVYTDIIKVKDSWDGKALPRNTVYLLANQPKYAQQLDGLVPGLYSFKSSWRFPGGPYQDFYNFRDLLADVSGYEASLEQVAENPSFYENKPFFPLVHFETGVIGPVTSRRLLEDFVRFKGDFRGWINIPYFHNMYAVYFDAFGMASQTGLVYFQ